MRDAGLSIKAWLDINDNDYDKCKEVLNGYVKWVNLVQHKSDPNDIDVRIGKNCITYRLDGQCCPGFATNHYPIQDIIDRPGCEKIRN